MNPKLFRRFRRWPQILICGICVICGFPALAITSFYFTNLDSSGAAITNAITFQAWPPGNAYTVNNGQIIYGYNQRTFTPTAGGYVSNTIYAGTYRMTVSNQPVVAYFNLPDTTNVINLANYITNAAVLNAAGYGAVKGQSSDTALGFIADLISATNGFLKITTNTSGGLSSFVWSTLWSPATNSSAGILYLLGFAPATNDVNSISNLLRAVFNPYLGYTPATNTQSAAINLLGFQPGTNGTAARFTLTDSSSAFTNGNQVWYSRTNTLPYYDSNYVYLATSTNAGWKIFIYTNTASGSNWFRAF